jgi:5-methylcytosine-specific restriction endonuclease McrA
MNIITNKQIKKDCREMLERRQTASALLAYRKHIRWRNAHNKSRADDAAKEMGVCTHKFYVMVGRSRFYRNSRWRPCGTCAEVKNLKDDFHYKKGASKDRAYECKLCQNKRVADYLVRNRQKEAARHRARRASDPEHEAAKTRKYYEKRKAEGRHLEYKNRRKALERGGNAEDCGAVYKAVRLQKWIHCHYCGKQVSGSDCHIDHVIPLSRGGDHRVANMVFACPRCNESKGSKLLSEWEGAA